MLEENTIMILGKRPKVVWKWKRLVGEVKNGKFIEIPITTQKPKSTFHYLYLKVLA